MQCFCQGSALGFELTTHGVVECDRLKPRHSYPSLALCFSFFDVARFHRNFLLPKNLLLVTASDDGVESVRIAVMDLAIVTRLV